MRDVSSGSQLRASRRDLISDRWCALRQGVVLVRGWRADCPVDAPGTTCSDFSHDDSVQDAQYVAYWADLRPGSRIEWSSRM